MLKPMIAALLMAAPAAPAWTAPADNSASATVEWRHKAESMVVLQDVAWRCSGQECSGPLLGRGPKAIAHYCRTLARYGEVTSFRASGQPLSAEDLQRCNRRSPGKTNGRPATAAAKAS